MQVETGSSQQLQFLSTGTTYNYIQTILIILKVIARLTMVYKFRKIIGKNDFPYHFKKIIVRYKKIGYNIAVRRHTACLVINPVDVNSFAYLFDCTTVGRASD